MSNEHVATINLIKTPLTIGLTTSVLAGCSMLPSLPANNTSGTKFVVNANNSQVKVRHALPSVSNGLPLQNAQLAPSASTQPINTQPVNTQPINFQPINTQPNKGNVSAKGALWQALLIDEASNKLSNKQTNPNDAKARIEAEKQRWLKTQRGYLNASLHHAPTYLHYLISQAELQNLPPKLALLPLIDSGYNPRKGKNAKGNSPAGLWRITPALAKVFNLKKNTSYDGRYDIVESTNTAYKFLGGLHRKYESDWALTLAAYSAGATVVDKAILSNKVQGKPTDFWSLNLPKETMEYVPRFLALVDIIENSNGYGVDLPFADTTRKLQFVRVNNGTKLDMVEAVSNVPLETLKVLNAGLLRDRVDTFTPRDIVLPSLVATNVIQKVEKLPNNYTYNQPYTTPLDNPVEPPTTNNKRPMENPNQPPMNKPPRYDSRHNNSFQPQGNTYVVQAGDTLSGLAHKFGIPRTVLAGVNNVDTEYLVKIGEVLHLPFAPNVNRRVDRVSAKRVQKNTRQSARKNHVANNGHYQVQEGDTLLGIAHKLNVSVSSIASLNGFDTQYFVKTGEVLTIPVNKPRKTMAKAPKHSSSYSGKYQVVSGDSLSSVASKFGLTKNQLARANNLDTESYLFIGQKINIPNKRVQTSTPVNKRKKVKSSKQVTNVKNVRNYRVQTGDSLTRLAQRYNISLGDLAKMNNISPLEELYAGTIIRVPQTQGQSRGSDVSSAKKRNKARSMGGKYEVRAGDGLIKLAKKFGISVDELARMNNISADSNLFLGQTLRIPKH